MKTNYIPTVVAASISCGMLVLSQAAPRYQVIDLGSLGGPHYYETFSGITGKLLNNSGVVAAGMDTSENDPACANGGSCPASHGFLWNNGPLFDLGLLAGGDQSNFSQSFSINEQNNCAGVSTFNVVGRPGEYLYRAVLWKFKGQAAPQLIDLGTLGGNQSLAHAINNHDQVAGWALNQVPASTNTWDAEYPFPFLTQQRAVLWNNGVIQDLGTLGGPSAWASHINDKGQIIGQSFTETDENRRRSVGDYAWTRPVAGFLWENGKMIDLGGTGGTYMLPTRINNQGQVSGFMSIRGDSTFHPFLWTNGVLKDLGTFGGAYGQANALNESGEVAGYAATSSGANYAFLWRNGVLRNLGTLGANSAAWAINAKTQVVGTSGRTFAEFRAFLWEDSGASMRDLNALVPAGSPRLAYGININDRGEILCGGVDEKGLYLLVPLPAVAVRLSKTAAGPRVVVEAQTIPGKTYRLESSANLKNWTASGPSFVADQETVTQELETGRDPVFYRIAGPLL